LGRLAQLSDAASVFPQFQEGKTQDQAGDKRQEEEKNSGTEAGEIRSENPEGNPQGK